MRRLLSLIVIVAAVGAALWTAYWAYLTTTVRTPYDEMWIGLNSTMPQPLRHWACDQVKARQTPRGVAPYGCQDRW